jgi:hypothetical protein
LRGGGREGDMPFTLSVRKTIFCGSVPSSSQILIYDAASSFDPAVTVSNFPLNSGFRSLVFFPSFPFPSSSPTAVSDSVGETSTYLKKLSWASTLPEEKMARFLGRAIQDSKAGRTSG